jgi:hypothetical protein
MRAARPGGCTRRDESTQTGRILADGTRLAAGPAGRASAINIARLQRQGHSLQPGGRPGKASGCAAGVPADEQMKRIAFTFAGRQRTMRNQVIFVRRLLALGLLDEWHIWNFARKREDEQWLQRTFAEDVVVYTFGKSAQYVPLRNAAGSSARILLRASNDAQLRFRLDSGETVEVVFGASNNTKSILRTFGPPSFETVRLPVTAESTATLELFDDNAVEVEIADRRLCIRLNGRTVFSPATPASSFDALEAQTGNGSSGQWTAGDPQAKVRLFNTGLKSQEGFRFAYAHYANARFHDAVFVKLDDDIVFCDVDRFEAFVKDLETSDELKISSANVINNGVCAHYQDRAGYFHRERFGFEYPKDGTCGRLWESSALCERLHRYFLRHRDEIIAIASGQPANTELPQVDRYSINFVGFRYPVMIMMTYLFAMSKAKDDELLMSVLLPTAFGVRKYVFNHLVVCHLSFYKQDETLDSAGLLEAYGSLY